MQNIILQDAESHRKCQSIKEENSLKINIGGYGALYRNGNIVIKSTWIDDFRNPEEEENCLTGKGCNHDNPLMEGLILSILDKFNLPNIPKFYGLYVCDNTYKLFMEFVEGQNLEVYAKNGLNDTLKLTILFQILHTLYTINRHVKFIHGDLFNSNIIISKVPLETYEVNINGSVFKVSNNGILVKLIDYGESQLEVDSLKLYHTYVDTDNLFNQAIDICRLFTNPILKVTGKCSYLDNIINKCQSNGYIPIPPFPVVTYSDILQSTLFDFLKIHEAHEAHEAHDDFMSLCTLL